MANDTCPFCSDTLEVIDRSRNFIAIRDRYPVSEGHSLIISNRHVANYFELSEGEKIDGWQLLDRVKETLIKEYNPDGFNIGINVGESAGQTVFHVHIHIIPRYNGDIDNPRGGVRHVIPSRGYY